MSKAKTLVTNFRRMSTPMISRRASKASPAGQPKGGDGLNDTTAKTGTSIFFLPTELLVQILLPVSCEDLCAVRRTCRAASHLLSTGDIVGQWLGHNLSEQQLTLYPPPSPPNFVYAVEQQRRFNRAGTAAAAYTNYIEKEIVRYTLKRRPSISAQEHNDAMDALWELIQAKLIPLLLTLQHHLERCAGILLELCDNETTYTSSTLRREFAARERAHIDSYEPLHLRQLYKFWLFFTWLSNQVLGLPSYASTFERAMRGWGVEIRPYERNLIMVFGSLAALAEVMVGSKLRDRRRAIAVWLGLMDPARTSSWQMQWRRFGLRYDVCPTEKQAGAASNVKLQVGEVFANSAKAVLLDKGLLDTEEREIGSSIGSSIDSSIGTSHHCTDFLYELVGYDILHVPPSIGLQQLELLGDNAH